MEVTLHLKGLRPLLMHNGRLANPLDPHVEQMAAIKAKRKKTRDDHFDLMMLQARGGCWETEEGLLGVPDEAVWRSIYDAATAFRRGMDIKRALLPEGQVRPLMIGKTTVDCDQYLVDFKAHIHYVPVKIGNVKVMGARPIVHEWASTHTFDLLTDVLDESDLAAIVARAGRLVGIGDWRPTYGRYEPTMETGA